MKFKFPIFEHIYLIPMKTQLTIILKNLGLIKNGYPSPYVLVACAMLFLSVPFITKILYYDEVAEKQYLKDEELIELIVSEYDSLETTDIVLVEEEYDENGQVLAEIRGDFDDDVVKRKSENVDFKKIQRVVREQKSKSANNLTKLLIKAREDSDNLTKWDHFRLQVYRTALNLKKRYPEIDGTPSEIYQWSMKTFHQESRYNGNASNPHSSARGIFQAMASTRKALNMPVGLTEFEQVPYYEKYIIMQIEGQKINPEKLGSALDWYLITFYPRLADKGDHAKFAKCNAFARWACSKGWKKCNYHANQAYDLDEDAIITKAEIGEHLMRPKK